MPSHFTHIYTARRVADLLLSGEFKDWPSGVDIPYDAATCGQAMRDWEKFTAIGAIGPDLFYFSQDYNTPPIGQHSDKLMLSLATYYFFYSAKQDNWEPLLKILASDISPTMAAIIRFLIELEQLWQKFVAGWNSTIGPIVDAAGQILDDLSGGVISQAQVVIEELKTGFVNVIEQELLTYKDIFGAFDTCVNKGWQENAFLWSDMSHYRRTSAMCQALVAQAERLRKEDQAAGRDDTRFRQFLAFALGYMTHIGTDTIGHSFVNEQCGGPFRNHPQRHHLIENHIDAWNYLRSGDGTIPADPWGATSDYPEMSMSALQFMVHLTPDDPRGAQRPSPVPSDPDARKAALKVDGELPDWMCEAIVLAMMDVFGDQPHPLIFGGNDFQASINQGMLTDAVETVTGHGLDRPWQDLLQDIAPTPSFKVPPGFPMPWEIQTMYHLMLSFYWFQFNGSWELQKPQAPDPVIVPPSSDFTNLFQPPDFSGVDSSNPIEDICEALIALAEWAGKELGAAGQLAGDIVKMLASPSTYLLRLGLYEVAMMVWDVITKTHEVLAHTGFMMPHGQQVYDSGELRLPNEIDLPLITLGGTTDAAFQQALADAFDPLGNLDKVQGIVAQGHQLPDPHYPYYSVLRFHADGSTEHWEFRRPWTYPDKSRFAPARGDDLEISTKTENYDASQPAGLAPPNPYPDPYPYLRSGPYAALTRPHEVFFRTDAPVNPRVRALYEHSTTPAATDFLNAAYLLTAREALSPLGDPVPFSAYLIGQLVNHTGYRTQFNLDSDRAYGYLTWDWIRGSAPGTTATGFHYIKPAVAPEDAAGDWQQGNQPLLLQYLGVAVPPPGQPPPAADTGKTVPAEVPK
jgi:hypothetical protein